MKETKLFASKIIEIGEGKPIIGIVGLVHGNEPCGRKALDHLVNSPPKLKGTLRLFYANLKAEDAYVRGVDSNLNRVFPGDSEGDIEKKIAASLAPHFDGCDYLLDIHSTSYPTEPFAISVIDSPEYDALAAATGLNKYVIMVDKMASGGSLIDEAIRRGAKAISFEAGTHEDDSSVTVAQKVINDFLGNLGVIETDANKSSPEKFYGVDVVKVPNEEFTASSKIHNFELLKAGTSYGSDEEKEFSLDYDCYPFLYSDKLVDNDVFVVSVKNKDED